MTDQVSVTPRTAPKDEPLKWFLAVLAAACGILALNLALGAFLYTVIADRLDGVATKDQLDALVAMVATKDELAALTETAATKEQLAALAETAATKEQLAALTETTAAKFDGLEARMAVLASVSWDPDTPILTSDSKTESDLLYFGPKPEGTWSTVLGQFVQQPGVNVQQVDPSYSLLDYLRGEGASSIPENLKSPLDLK